MTKTETYMRGMNDINSFYSMLYAAMRTSMPVPDAQISQSGAYVWRGYRIDAFRNLAQGQYYCQIYPDQPGILMLQEGYLDAKHRGEEKEKKLGIKAGHYYYPFTETIDLRRTRFFEFNQDEQLGFLRSFIDGALQKALIWQQSDVRQNVTNPKFQHGKVPRLIRVRVPETFDRVGEDFLAAWEYQRLLWGVLRNILDQVPNKEWVRPNANIHNFGFRGLRLKLISSSQTSRWSIYFNKPERILFQIPKGRQNPYNLVENRYFDLPTHEQEKQLRGFVQASLGITL